MVHERGRRSLRRGLAGGVLAAALLAACQEGSPAPFNQAGDPPANGTNGNNSNSGTTGAIGTTGTTGNTGNTGKEGDGDVGNSVDGLAWVPFGPGDPTSPTPDWPFYRALAKPDCPGLRQMMASSNAGNLNDDPLAKAAVAVCAAAVEGKQDQWARAQAALAEGGFSSQLFDCIADAVRGLVVRALAWHDSHPGARPAVKSYTVQKTACATTETDTRTDTGTTSGTTGSRDTTSASATSTTTSTSTTTATTSASVRSTP